MLHFPKENWDLRCKYLVCGPKTGISDRKTRYFTKHQMTRKVLGYNWQISTHSVKEGDVNNDLYSRMQITWHVK